MAETLLLLVVTFLAAGPEQLGARGRLSGRVWTAETDAAPTRVRNSTDPEVCGREHTLDDLVVSADGGVRYAIVALSGVPEERFPEAEAETVVVDNRSCRFEPHAAVARVGDVLEARNSDPLLHTTHLYGPADINLSLAAEGVRRQRRLDEPGLYMVKCDIHGWMQAFVRVDPHPFHAVTDAEGRFAFDAPPGKYRLEVWHERLGSRELEVEIQPGSTTSIEVKLPAP